LWNLVDAIGLWNQIDQLGRDLNNDEPLPFMDFFSFSKMVSYGTVVAVVNVVIITALGTLLAFLYNIVAALLGGLKLTFADEGEGQPSAVRVVAPARAAWGAGLVGVAAALVWWAWPLAAAAPGMLQSPMP